MSDKLVNYDLDLKKWNVSHVMPDVIWALMIDEPDADEIKKTSGLYVKTEQTLRGVFRIGKVLKVGKDIENVKEGDFILIPPQGVGVQGHKTVDGHKTWFLREPMITAVINFDGTKEEFIKHVKEDLWATL